MSLRLPSMSREPVIRPSDTDLQRVATTLNDGARVAIYAGSGCHDAHDQVVALAKLHEGARSPTRRGPRISSNTTIPSTSG